MTISTTTQAGEIIFLFSTRSAASRNAYLGAPERAVGGYGAPRLIRCWCGRTSVGFGWTDRQGRSCAAHPNSHVPSTTVLLGRCGTRCRHHYSSLPTLCAKLCSRQSRVIAFIYLYLLAPSPDRPFTVQPIQDAPTPTRAHSSSTPLRRPLSESTLGFIPRLFFVFCFLLALYVVAHQLQCRSHSLGDFAFHGRCSRYCFLSSYLCI